MFRNMWFYVIASSSENTAPVTYVIQGEEVVNLAADSLMRRGESLENMAGIESVEDADGNFSYERELTDAELRKHCVAELNETGIFLIYHIDSDEGDKFIHDASLRGLEMEARELCARHPKK